MQAIQDEAKTDPTTGDAPVTRIRREQLSDGVMHLVFDRPDSPVNVFDLATLQELDEHLDAMRDRPDVNGIILSSAKPSIFIAGADIKQLFREDAGEEDIRHAVRTGQQVFNKLAAMEVPTVAAIHGAALGGGYEVALACDYRVASDDKSTKIGLPETALGILPAWGGSTRLPRMVGLQAALDVILGGKRLAAGKAKKIGMVDAVVPRERLLEIAHALIGQGKPKGARGFFKQHNPVSKAIIRAVAGKAAHAKTRGHYPAIPAALDVVVSGLGSSPERSFRREEDAIAKLAQTDVCRNLVRVFFLQERSKGFRYPLPAGTTPESRAVTDVAVIGAGVMGAGIAQWSSARGQDVLLKDIAPEALAKGLGTIAKTYHDATTRRIFTRREAQAGQDRIFATTEPVPLNRIDIVIEAAVENMEIKKKLFSELAGSVRDDTLLATNTSALSITRNAEGIPHPERVVGIHYFNPVHRMQLVEVVVGENTSPEVVDRAVRFVQKLGKLPVVVKDSPGFLVNRILMPYLAEAGCLFEAGASPEELDKAMLDFGMPMGPIRLTDEVGVDVCAHVARHQAEQFGDRMPMPAVLDRMIEAGLLGRKSGSGFYTYRGKKTQVNAAVRPFVSSSSKVGMDRRELAERMSLLMVNEAARCVEEELVAGPEDVDFGMIFGAGFAPFRGGPLRYADTRGIVSVVDALQARARAGEAHFTPCDLLLRMASDRKQFYEAKER